MRHERRLELDYAPHRFLQRMRVFEAVCPTAAEAIERIRGSQRELRSKANRDDLIDAMVAALTATTRNLKVLPEGEPPLDNSGLPMRIADADWGRGSWGDGIG